MPGERKSVHVVPFTPVRRHLQAPQNISSGYLRTFALVTLFVRQVFFVEDGGDSHALEYFPNLAQIRVRKP
jgi:hypothetical protein